ncbi:MAG: NGG1p interacting factor NIF3 [Candidatus Omnitrophica bacterium]|nr:NGG1p interacting factor NIF3 [Candidatus Omnitrophota bacterium]
MKLSEFYNLAVEFGKDKDPRQKNKIKSFPDTAILHGKPDTKINCILAGIDIEVGELLLADKIRQERGLDLVLTHHPEGGAWARFYQVMKLQADMFSNLGIPKDVAEQMIDVRMQEVERRVMPNNHMRAVDVARLLDMPFMCCHTPADNHVFRFLQGLFAKKKPGAVSDMVDILMDIPEYKMAEEDGAGPKIIAGNPSRSVGKIFVEMTGGTEGPREIYEKIYKKGIRTIVCMHLSEEHFKKVKDANLNVIIAGHISSDTLGLNLLLDRIEKEEHLEFIDCSGFRRIRRQIK